MAKAVIKIAEGDEVTIRASVRGVWPDRQFTVQFKTAAQKGTFPNTGDTENIYRRHATGSPKGLSNVALVRGGSVA